jgi:MFS family permease
MNYLPFFRAHRSLLGFGLLTALSTSFGQTFFISLFLVHFQDSFGIDKSGVGFLYAAATLGSALLLPYFGARIDGADLARYTTVTMAALALSALVVAASFNLWMLGAGLLGLRLLGQGLLGHISHTVMAREFGVSRGKALGVAGIGYPLGEALLPIGSAALLWFFSWRGVWVLVAALAGLVLLPATLRLLRDRATMARATGAPEGTVPASGNRDAWWRDRRAYFVLPSVLVPPFVLTGLFLYQAVLAQSKGWALEWMAAAFAAFAVTRVVTSLAIGPVIDRFTATRLLPLYMLPLAAGMLMLMTGDSPLLAFPYLILAGITAGANGSIASAVWAELYGASRVGRVRSSAAALAIFTTALSPALMGWLFLIGVTLENMMTAGAWMIALATAASVPVSRYTRNMGLPSEHPVLRKATTSNARTGAYVESPCAARPSRSVAVPASVDRRSV